MAIVTARLYSARSGAYERATKRATGYQRWAKHRAFPNAFAGHAIDCNTQIKFGISLNLPHEANSAVEAMPSGLGSTLFCLRWLRSQQGVLPLCFLHCSIGQQHYERSIRFSSPRFLSEAWPWASCFRGGAARSNGGPIL